MSFVGQTDRIVQRSRAVGARYFGQTFDVFRLSSASTVQITLTASQIAANVPVEYARMTDRDDLEIEATARALFYTAVADMRTFLPGDVFVQRTDSYRYDGTILTCAATRPAPRNPVFASSPVYATITRPKANPNSIDSGRRPMNAPMKANEIPLVLESGVYAFPDSLASAEASTAAQIPVGVVMDRQRDYPKSEDPVAQLFDDTRRQTWTFFVPQLGDTLLLPRDIISVPSGDRYEITGVQPQQSGFIGQLVVTQRLR